MGLRASTPAARKQRLRCLIYGPPGVGKTTAAIQFPSPYVIDTEGGTDYYGDIIERSGGVVWQSSSIDEVTAEVLTLARESHPYRTIVIDPFTSLFDTATEEGVATKGDEFGKHTAFAKSKSKRLIRALEAADMNVVLTSHEAPRWDAGKEAGTKPAGWADLPYFADVVFQLRLIGKKRIAKVEKCRPSWFEDQGTFEWSFEAIADAVGPQMFDDATPTQMATSEQAVRLHDLCERVANGADRMQKFLARMNAERITEIPADQVAKAIAAIETEIGA